MLIKMLNIATGVVCMPDNAIMKCNIPFHCYVPLYLLACTLLALWRSQVA